MRLAEPLDISEAPTILGPLTDPRDVLVEGGLRHDQNADRAHCPKAMNTSEGHARLMHLRNCPTCYPQGRAA